MERSAFSMPLSKLPLLRDNNPAAFAAAADRFGLAPSEGASEGVEQGKGASSQLPFFPYYACLFGLAWCAMAALRVPHVTLTPALLVTVLAAVFLVGRDSAGVDTEPRVTRAQSRAAGRGAAVSDGATAASKAAGGVPGGAAEEDDSWRPFAEATTVGRLVPFGTVLRRAEEFSAASEAGGGNKWSEPPGDTFWCRGLHYLSDKKKFTSRQPCFPLLGIDLWMAPDGGGPCKHFAPHSQSYVSKLLRNPAIDPAVASAFVGCAVGPTGLPPPVPPDLHVLVVNFYLPWGNFVAYFLRPPSAAPTIAGEAVGAASAAEAGAAAGEAATAAAKAAATEAAAEAASKTLVRRLYDQFVAGDDEYRDARFKIIPRVFEGPWFVRHTVGKGNKAAKLAEQIELAYHNGPHYFEVGINVSESAFGNKILGVVKQNISNISIDLAFIIEGVTTAELPERVLGALRFHNLDVPNAPVLPNACDQAKDPPQASPQALAPEAQGGGQLSTASGVSVEVSARDKLAKGLISSAEQAEIMRCHKLLEGRGSAL